MKVKVRVPDSRHGVARLRRPGAKRLRLTDTDDEIRAGLNGGAGVASKAAEPGSDYFTSTPEEVEFTPWIERMVRKGSLEIVPASPPKTTTTKASASEPVPMTKE